MKLNDKWRAFADAYLNSMDPKAAYKSVYGDDISDAVAVTCASRLLRNAHVAEYVDKKLCERSERLELDADAIVLRFWRVYQESMAAKDRKTALAALDKLMKHLGGYERHNRQKTVTDPAAEAERIRHRLRERGLDVDKLFPLPQKPEPAPAPQPPDPVVLDPPPPAPRPPRPDDPYQKFHRSNQ